jgi:hypothetical protein
VALQAAECQANPSRGVQYTLVPDEYREAKGLPANASVCTSRRCHRHVELLPPAGQPGRRQTPVSRKRLPDDTAADGHVRGPSPSHRQRPAVVNTVYELKAVRRTAVDCERQTTDEVVQGARRNALPLTSAPNEYQVHGEFKMAAEDRAFPDTYIFTLAQLHAAGLSKTLIKEKLLEFEQQLKVKEEELVVDAGSISDTDSTENQHREDTLISEYSSLNNELRDNAE